MSNRTNRIDAEIIVATYNLQHSSNVALLSSNVTRMAEDGVQAFCLQEVSKAPGGDTYIIAEMMHRLGKDWRVYEYLGQDEDGDSENGTAILWNSRFLRLMLAQRIDLPPVRRLMVHEWLFDKIVGGRGRPFQRRAIKATFLHHGKQVAISTLHLDHVGGIAQRLRQLRHFLSVDQNEIQYEIIGGDFNTLDLRQRGNEKEQIAGLLGAAFTDAANGVGWTADLIRMDVPEKPLVGRLVRLLNIHVARHLDYIWVKGFHVVSCQKLFMDGSDHLPVVATLEFGEHQDDADGRMPNGLQTGRDNTVKSADIMRSRA